ncbi:SWIM zinc finger family protein [Actinoplanes sp. N902-109]|uniref:SWIM zinc finger family protein n=1 Tax=Actinoplanes sp. (strain N902-109) TaxID=649831 RepID=UPI0003295EE0|nr:SWIM zinc finger family protein [Actinoplanes sp. N902-109]AGL13922.1 zinc finger domain-containing protein [Actinoplanes sp. N902-109]
MPVDPDGRWFDSTGPIRVDGGIAVRAQRGKIGEQWWSRRFVDLLEQICQPGRLGRGRAYARKGQVIGFEMVPGRVVGRVQGSRPAPYEVTISIPAFDAAQWTEVFEVLGARALYRAALLAGDMPHEIVDVFDEVGLPLFPATLDMRCSCPDWGVPCKHVSAVLYVLAEAFDDDPFLVLAWRGRDRESVLSALRGLPEPVDEDDPLTVGEEPLEARLTDYYSPGISLGRLRERPPRTTAPPELLLRVLDAPTIRVRHIPLADILRPAYRDLGDSQQA